MPKIIFSVARLFCSRNHNVYFKCFKFFTSMIILDFTLFIIKEKARLYNYSPLSNYPLPLSQLLSVSPYFLLFSHTIFLFLHTSSLSLSISSFLSCSHFLHIPLSLIRSFFLYTPLYFSLSSPQNMHKCLPLCMWNFRLIFSVWKFLKARLFTTRAKKLRFYLKATREKIFKENNSKAWKQSKIVISNQ